MSRFEWGKEPRYQAAVHACKPKRLGVYMSHERLGGAATRGGQPLREGREGGKGGKGEEGEGRKGKGGEGKGKGRKRERELKELCFRSLWKQQ